MKKTAVLFPGQGTQAWGMGKELYNTYPVAKSVFDEADRLLGFSFSKKLFETCSTEIMDTEIAQVSIFLTSVAYYKVFVEGNDILPDSFAGHSVGEYAALVCSGAMRFEDGLSLIRKRGQLMQKISDDMADGGMLAIIGMTYLEVSKLTDVCQKEGIDVSISAYNDIRQIVISGRKGALNLAKERFEAAGSKTKMLEVNTAFHNPCMNEIVGPLEKLIGSFTIALPKGKVYCNVTGKAYKSTEEIYEYLPVQVSECVRFYDICSEMIEDENDVFIEVGRGKVLSNLLTKNRKGAYDVYSLSDKRICDIFTDRIRRGIDFGSINLLGSISGKLLSKPGFNEAGTQLYNRITEELSECIKENKIPSGDAICSLIEEYLEICTENQDRDKWCEYAQYFRVEVKGDE